MSLRERFCDAVLSSHPYAEKNIDTAIVLDVLQNHRFLRYLIDYSALNVLQPGYSWCDYVSISIATEKKEIISIDYAWQWLSCGIRP